MSKFDQGTIIHGIRSDKYPEARCFGIVISASCDIANCKISKIYYLIAINVKDWILSDSGFHEVFNNRLKAVEKEISDVVEENNIEWDSLKNFSEDDAKRVIRAECRNKDKVISAYDKYMSYTKQICSRKGKIDIANIEQKSTVKYLGKISKGEVLHYYFLPQTAYKNDNTRNNGLIVDLQEIDSLSIEEAEIIEKEGIDYLKLPEDEKQKAWFKKKYWLNNKDDFVIICDTISSPWREHLMQRFSHGFIRIGIDGATDDDFKAIAEYK